MNFPPREMSIRYDDVAYYTADINQRLRPSVSLGDQLVHQPEFFLEIGVREAVIERYDVFLNIMH